MSKLSKVDWWTKVRQVGNISIVVGYFVLMNVDFTTGVLIRLVANLMVAAWAVRHKMWDLVGVLSFLMAIELHKLIVTLFL